jgi:hypothetical protein
MNQLTDFNNIPMAYADSVAFVYGNGIILGYPDHTFKYEMSLTRAEASVIVDRVLSKTASLE